MQIRSQTYVETDFLSLSEHFAPHEAALLLDVDAADVHAMLNCGELPYFMFNGRRRIRRDEVFSRLGAESSSATVESL